jgi:uncharacterized protein involved in exopolysaccharide biosynthesis
MSVSAAVDIDLLQVSRRHFGKMLLVFAVVCAAVCAYFVVAKRIYTSEARVFVRLGRETVGLDPTSTSNQIMSVPDARENEVNAVQQLILSRTVAEEVVDAIGVDAILESRSAGGSERGIMSRLNELLAVPAEEPRDSAIGKFQRRLRVQTSEHSSVITVSYQCASADLSTKVLAAVLASARKGHIRINRVDGSDTFFAEQSDQWKREVNRLEDAMRSFRNTSGVSNIALQREIQLNHIAKLKIALLENEAEVQAAEAQLAKQESILGTEPEHLVVSKVSDMPNTAAQGMQQQLYAVKLKEAELLAKFKPEHVLVKQVREEVGAASRALKQIPTLTQVTEGMNQVRQELRAAMLNQKATIAGLKAKSDALRTEFAATQLEMKTLNEQQPRIDQLTGELDLAQASYRGYYQKHEQARIDQALRNESISNLNILQPPSGSRIPTWPQPIPTFALGMLLALVAGVATAIAAEYRRPTQQPVTRPTVPPPHRSLHVPSNGTVVRS